MEQAVALSTRWFNDRRQRFQMIRITTDDGKSTTANVVDEYDSRNGCDADHAGKQPCRNNIFDGSAAVWSALGLNTDVREVHITWPNPNDSRKSMLAAAGLVGCPEHHLQFFLPRWDNLTAPGLASPMAAAASFLDLPLALLSLLLICLFPSTLASSALNGPCNNYDDFEGQLTCTIG
ncbi:hypothetical protein EJ110_NYTH37142 [Nymphaea thermarum]|nr:hypothetical protein EJ110_NYTH37142 [Nymphaea thermarum]